MRERKSAKLEANLKLAKRLKKFNPALIAHGDDSFMHNCN